jgi:hypothetical protein
MQAVNIITDAFERLNRLSAGETLNADDAAKGLRRLNLLVDEWSAKRQFLYKSVLTAAAQTGNITLAAGAWATIPVGTEIIGVTVDDEPIDKLTMLQYSGLYDPTETGDPVAWAYDGFSNVYLYPVATGQSVELLTSVTATTFADLTTNYTAPPGYENALGASLAVRLAPSVLGKLPPDLVRAERAALMGVMGWEPAVVDYDGYQEAKPSGNILNGWN